MSYAHGASATPLLGETIGENLKLVAEGFPHNEALVDHTSGRRWTYGEFQSWVTRIALGLADRGVRKGDRVGIWSPNCPEWVAIQYGTAMLGAILVTINPAYRASELEFVLNQAGITTLVSAVSHKSVKYREMVDLVRPAVGTLEDVIFIGDQTWEDLEESGMNPTDLLSAEARNLSTDDPINIQYTSGTTGFPKGATLSHHNILNNAFFVGETLGYTDADRICVPVPFYHCFGMVMANLAATSHGATVVIPAPSFDPAATLAAVQAERCTSLYGVPTMFIAELALPDFSQYDLTSLRTGIMAGSPCPVEVMRRVETEMHMPEITIAYGMTETSPVSAQTNRRDDLYHRTETVGQAAPHVEIKIVDPVTGAVVRRGLPGEFCTRGYSVMLGYWGEPGLTADAVDSSRWMHTGDLAVMSEDGYVNIVGRIKDMIIRGGENIYPREVEEFLHTHPDIDDVSVIGVPDERYGEEIVAWIRPKPGSAALDIGALRSFCAGRIAHQKIPRYLRIADEFPLTVTGKVRKVEMRRISVAELGLEAAAGVRTA